MYSRYVLRTKIEGKDSLYHTLTGEFLPVDATPKQLRDGKFLWEQNREVLFQTVFKRRNRLKFYFVPTWECSLRCPMCFVGKNLEPHDGAKFDPEKFNTFLTRYHKRYPENKKIEVAYLGGEPLLNIDDCVKINKAVIDFCNGRDIRPSQTITTNGTVTLTDTHIEFLKRLDFVTVSVDGDEEHHNASRRVYDRVLLNGESPYKRTLKFIRRLCKEGIDVQINAALSEDIYNDSDRLKEFLVVLLCLGVKRQNILTGTVIPNSVRKVDPYYSSYLEGGPVFNRPCCVWQYMSFFSLHGTKLYSNYYEMDDTYVGELDTDLDLISEAYHRIICKKMPVINDPICLECPVIGYCWGNCYHSGILRESPSTHCNRQALTLKVLESAARGDIAEFGDKNRCKGPCIKI